MNKLRLALVLVVGLGMPMVMPFTARGEGGEDRGEGRSWLCPEPGRSGPSRQAQALIAEHHRLEAERERLQARQDALRWELLREFQRVEPMIDEARALFDHAQGLIDQGGQICRGG